VPSSGIPIANARRIAVRSDRVFGWLVASFIPIMDLYFVIMVNLLQGIETIFLPVTPPNLLMPPLAQAMTIVSVIMVWLVKVMARSEKVIVFLAKSFSGTCSGPVSAVKSYHRLFRGASANQHIFM